MKGFANKRKQDRKNLIYFPTVYLAGTEEEFGRIIDITTGGFMLVRQEPLPEQSVHQLRIHWTGEDGKEHSFECAAKVCWCKKDVNPELYALGCRLDEQTSEVAAEIARMITRWSFPEW